MLSIRNPLQTSRHILIKLTKTKHKERILKAAREKQQVSYKGHPIRLTADLSAETLQARREWQNIFKLLKVKNLQPRLLYLARISFIIDGEIKTFSARLPWRPTRGSLTSPSYLAGNRTLGPPLENNPEPPPSSRLEGLRLLYGLETSLSTSLQTPQEA